MLEMHKQAAESGADLEAREDQLVGTDDNKAAERHRKRLMVKQRDSEQRQSEQDEVDWNSVDKNGFNQDKASARF